MGLTAWGSSFRLQNRSTLLCPKAKRTHPGGQDPREAVTFMWKFPQYLVRKPALSHWKHWLVWCSSAMLSF